MKSKFNREKKKEMICNMDCLGYTIQDCLDYDKGEGGNAYITSILAEIGSNIDNIDKYPNDLQMSLDSWQTRYELMMKVRGDNSAGLLKVDGQHYLLSLEADCARTEAEMLDWYPASVMCSYLKSKLQLGQEELECDQEVEHDCLVNQDVAEVCVYGHVKTKSCCETHIIHKDLEDKYRITGLELRLIEDIVEPYKPSQVRLATKNGQKKLGAAYLYFVHKFSIEPGQRVLFYGSAPGYMILEIANYLGHVVICIDDYPTVYYEKNEYYSFDEFKENIGEIAQGVDAVFFDSWYDDRTYADQYTSVLSVLRNCKNVPYSIKRFVEYSSSVRRIVDSYFIPLIYSSAGTREVREMGRLEDQWTTTTVSGLDDGLRYFNQYIRLGIASAQYVIHCCCYDCYALSYMLLSYTSARDVELDPLLSIVQSFDKGNKKDFVNVMISSMNSRERFSLPSSRDFVHNGQFAWNYNRFNENYEQFSVKSSSDKLVDQRLFRGVKVFDVDGEKISPIDKNYRYVSENSKTGKEYDQNLISDINRRKGVVRYRRPPLKVEVHILGLVCATYALPAINITSKYGVECYYSPVGSNVVISWDDVYKEPPCVVCGAASVINSLSFRNYVACFHPQAMDCQSCETLYRFDYFDIIDDG